jgi:hypothetical protein
MQAFFHPLLQPQNEGMAELARNIVKGELPAIQSIPAFRSEQL